METISQGKIKNPKKNFFVHTMCMKMGKSAIDQVSCPDVGKTPSNLETDMKTSITLYIRLKK